MRRYRQKSRRGAVLVAALICLLIALSIATTMVTESVARRVQLPIELSARQAELLIQAGRGRAAMRLTADAGYEGERWAPPIGAGKHAVVTIEIEASGDDATRVSVAAIYPDGDPKAVRRSRVYLITNADLSEEE